MTERQILFSAPMVRAILAGTKTQTRRVVKPQPTGQPRPLSEWSSRLAAACHAHAPDPEKLAAHSARLKGSIFPFTTESGGLMSPTCPYGAPGDRLWVRETWRAPGAVPRSDDPARPGMRIEYRADQAEATDGFAWRPSIFMPRWASRITLEVTGIRVERLQAISEADAAAEGFPYKIESKERLLSPIIWYSTLFEHINGAGSWDENPWVWIIEFKRVDSHQ